MSEYQITLRVSVYDESLGTVDFEIEDKGYGTEFQNGMATCDRLHHVYKHGGIEMTSKETGKIVYRIMEAS